MWISVYGHNVYWCSAANISPLSLLWSEAWNILVPLVHTVCPRFSWPTVSLYTRNLFLNLTDLVPPVQTSLCPYTSLLASSKHYSVFRLSPIFYRGGRTCGICLISPKKKMSSSSFHFATNDRIFRNGWIISHFGVLFLYLFSWWWIISFDDGWFS